MKKFAFTYCTLLAMQFSFAQTNEQKANAFLKKMTIEKRAGQMTQVTLGGVCTVQDGVLNTTKLRDAIVNHKVGSILDVTNHA